MEFIKIIASYSFLEFYLSGIFLSFFSIVNHSKISFFSSQFMLYGIHNYSVTFQFLFIFFKCKIIITFIIFFYIQLRKDYELIIIEFENRKITHFSDLSQVFIRFLLILNHQTQFCKDVDLKINKLSLESFKGNITKSMMFIFFFKYFRMFSTTNPFCQSNSLYNIYFKQYQKQEMETQSHGIALKRQYSRITLKIKVTLIRMVFRKAVPLDTVIQELGLKKTTALNIIKRYKETGSLPMRKFKRLRRKKQEISNIKKEELESNAEAQDAYRSHEIQRNEQFIPTSQFFYQTSHFPWLGYSLAFYCPF